LFDEGIDGLGELLEIGEKEGLVERSGSWYSLPIKQQDNDKEQKEPISLGQGKQKVR